VFIENSISFILIYRSLNCADRKGICSPVNPGLEWSEGFFSPRYIINGLCGDTTDCFCWTIDYGLYTKPPPPPPPPTTTTTTTITTTTATCR